MNSRVFVLAICLLIAVVFPQASTGQSNNLQNLIVQNNIAGVRAAIEKNPKLLEQKLASQLVPLHYAIQQVKPDVVDVLLELGAPTDVKNSRKRTPLHVAISRGNERMTKSVLAKTKNVNAVDGSKASCLMYAVMYRQSDEIIDALMARGADLSLRNSSRQTPLHIACYYNRPKTAEKLIAAGSDLTAVDNNSNTPLLVACMISPALTRVMLAKGADPLVRNRQKQSALHLACRASQFNRSANSRNSQQWTSTFGLETLQLLLQKFDDVDIKDGQGFTPLGMAVIAANPDVIQALIQRGADPNYVRVGQGGGQDSPMVCQAAQFGQHEAIAALIKGGAKVNSTNPMGENPLHLAAQAGGNMFGSNSNSAQAAKPFLETIQVLLDAKTDPNLKNQQGQTPLHVAAQRDFFAGVELLVNKTKDLDFDLGTGSLLHWSAQNGLANTARRLLSGKISDLNQTDAKGRTPLQVAAEFGKTEIVTLLIRKGAVIDHVDQNETTALLLAATNGYPQIVRALINAGAEAGLLDESEQTALHLAAWNGHAEVVSELLKDTAEANPKTRSGYTPLHAAAWQGHAAVIQQLMAGGADANVTDSDGWTPLHKAAYRGHADAVKTLLAGGADRSLANGVGMTALEMAQSNSKPEVVELLK